jgi:N-formylmaleamate deformylase
VLAQTPEAFRQQWAMLLRMSIADPKQAAAVLDWMLQSGRATLAQAQFEALSSDLRAAVGNITAPILAIGTWAGREPLGLTHEKVERELTTQFQAARECRIVVTDRSRHFVMLDDPKWLAEQIAEFAAK